MAEAKYTTRRAMLFPHLYRCGHIEGFQVLYRARPHLTHFRIFIDAATLKVVIIVANWIRAFLFPHLYRCGHIEGYRPWDSARRARTDFRIFIDAATLKANT